jgi:hypothetical protein
MTARSTVVKNDLSHRVKRTDYKSTNNDAAQAILRGLGKSPDRDPNYVPAIPAVGPRIAFFDQKHERASRTQIAQLDETTIAKIAEAIYRLLEENLANLVELNTEIAGDTIKCPICSHGNCHHFHQRGEMTGAEVEEYLGCTRSTRNTWLHRGEMPKPVSATTPYRFCPHVIACFHYDKRVILPNGRYDRDEHLRLVPIAGAEDERKRTARGEKLSAHMRRENARRKTARKRSKGGAK